MYPQFHMCFHDGHCIKCINSMQCPRTEWVLKWPGQIVIAGCQTMWTTEVSEALDKRELPILYQKMLKQVHYYNKHVHVHVHTMYTVYVHCT